MKLKTFNNEIELIDISYRYLYPYLIRFFRKNELSIEWKNDIIFIPKENHKEFNEQLKNILRELLYDCYQEPTQKQRSKYSSRYEKIEFEGKIYILNYRTDVIGIISFALFYLISVTE